MASSAGQQRAAQRAATERGPVLSAIVEGKTYSLTPKDMTALDVRALREQAGYSYNGLARQAARDMDVDILAAIVWMARRIDGERDLTYDEVAGSITHGMAWEITTDAPDLVTTFGEDDSPEA